MATMQSMQSTIEALRVSLADVTTEVISLRAAANASATSVATLTATSKSAWEALSARADQTESDVTEVQGQVRRGGPGDGGAREPREWDLLHKGDLKEFNGDKKNYKPWTQKVHAFCNAKRPGFRKALIWASRLKAPISQNELTATQWEHINSANTKLYDMLMTMCTHEALVKVQTTPGDEQGFEAWRRIARMCEPSSRLTRIDRLNQITHTSQCGSMKEMLAKVEVWEQAWSRYETDHEVTLDSDLKLGALMKMLPPKEADVIKLKYVEDEAGLTYPVLRRQVEFWLESLQSSGPVPMDLSALSPTDVSKMSEDQLESALCVLREKGSSNGKGGKKGKKGGKKGKKGTKRRKGQGRATVGQENRRQLLELRQARAHVPGLPAAASRRAEESRG